MEDATVEVIPDADRVYLRIEGKRFKKGSSFVPAMITQHGDDGISVDWDVKCGCDPLYTLRRGDPDCDGVVSFNVGHVRQLNISIDGMPPHLSVDHDPVEDNEAHSLIKKLPHAKTSKAMIRGLLFRLIKLEIKSHDIDYSSFEGSIN